MKNSLLSDLINIYISIKCNEKCSIHCPNRIRCYLLSDLIISVSKHYK